MKRLEGCAWQDAHGTHVQLAGLIAKNSGHAAIVDIYPKGRIIYAGDPGCAEVFIEEWLDKGPTNIEHVVPWQGSVLIPCVDVGQEYSRVKIYVNGNEELDIAIGFVGEGSAEILPWKAIALAQWAQGARL